jgi:CheY-like chemotaxis protein
MKNRYNVMLVDDDYITNMINSTIFENLTEVNQVSCFTSPVTALHYLQNRCVGNVANQQLEPYPDLLLVDIKMCPIDGFDFVSELRKCVGIHFEKICTAWLTTSENPKDRFKSIDVGVYNYLTKPLTHQKAQWLINQLKPVIPKDKTSKDSFINNRAL